MTAPPLPRSLTGMLAEGPITPEVIHVGDEAWINVKDLRKILRYRVSRAKDHGYINALRWLVEALRDIQRPAPD